jgi:hypothetical protein
VVVDHDPVSFAVPADSRTRGRDDPGDFVTEDPRWIDEALIDLLHVGAAHAADIDADHHLAVSRFRSRKSLDFESGSSAIDGRAHFAHRAANLSSALSKDRHFIRAGPWSARRRPRARADKLRPV